MRIGIRFCPLEIIKVVSRELVRALDGYEVVNSQMNKCDILSSDTIRRTSQRISYSRLKMIALWCILMDRSTEVLQDVEHVLSFCIYLQQMLLHFMIAVGTSSSAITERPHDARVTSIHKIAELNFWATLLGALGKRRCFMCTSLEEAWST